MSTNNKLTDLLDTLIVQTKVWGDALEKGNSKLANKKDNEAIKTIEAIRMYGDLGQKALLELIDNEHKGVQFWVASYSMRYSLERALEVLNLLSEGQGAIALSAEMMLKLYYSGELNMP